MTCSLPAKVDILGVGVSATSYSQVAELCAQWISEGAGNTASSGHYICVTSVHGVMEARKDPRTRSALNQADLVTPDGMPLVWALRSFGAQEQERVYGPNLMLELCARAEAAGYRLFLYGGHPDTLELLERNLRRRFPNLIVAGTYSPPFRQLTAQEDEEISSTIAKAKPDLLFIGISTPKQDIWMAEHKDRFPGITMIGVGAAFDFHAGRIPQAPEWMQKRGLEWLYRLSQEPTRLWKRYVLVTPWFVPCWGIHKLSVVMRNFACGTRTQHR